jgi:hypothetical protein
MGHFPDPLVDRDHPEVSTSTASLTPFERRVNSQNGEDGILALILYRIGLGSHWFVEFRVQDGSEGNCVSLAQEGGWDGLFIEGDDENYPLLEDRWKGDPQIRVLHAKVTAGTVNELFASAGVPAEVDVLSIDVDGNDYWIWEALQGFRPRIVVIEYNASVDPEATVAMPREDDHAWDGTDYFGASIGALRRLGRDRGYRLVHTDSVGVNAFFVREDLAAPFLAEDEVPLHPPAYGTDGGGHRRDPEARQFVDVRTGERVDAPRR